eukprot:scaffold38524_cov33-Tisochrysis_lutea.AAC.3
MVPRSGPSTRMGVGAGESTGLAVAPIFQGGAGRGDERAASGGRGAQCLMSPGRFLAALHSFELTGPRGDLDKATNTSRLASNSTWHQSRA